MEIIRSKFSITFYSKFFCIGGIIHWNKNRAFTALTYVFDSMKHAFFLGQILCLSGIGLKAAGGCFPLPHTQHCRQLPGTGLLTILARTPELFIPFHRPKRVCVAWSESLFVLKSAIAYLFLFPFSQVPFSALSPVDSVANSVTNHLDLFETRRGAASEVSQSMRRMRQPSRLRRFTFSS